MSIDYKIRKATLETAINVILLQKRKSTPRSARNIIDIGCCLSTNILTDVMKYEIYIQLVDLISDEDIKGIKKLVFNIFL